MRLKLTLAAMLASVAIPAAAARQRRAAALLVSDCLDPIEVQRRAWSQLAESGLKVVEDRDQVGLYHTLLQCRKP